MKNIGAAQVNVFHRHFSDDSFAKVREQSQLTDLKIITYVGLSNRSNRILGALKYIYSNFVKEKCNACQIVLGVKKIQVERLEKDIGSVKEFLEDKTNVTLYVHSRSHVKMISSQEITIIGSQNISQTSNNFFENASKGFKEVYNDHEVIFELTSGGYVLGENLFNEVVNDAYSCFLVQEQSPAELANQLRSGYQYKNIIKSKGYLRYIQEAINDVEFSYFNNEVEVNYYDIEILLGLLEVLHDNRFTSSAHDDSLAEISHFLHGDDGIFRNGLLPADAVLELVAELQDTAMDSFPKSISDNILKTLKEVENLMDFSDLRKLNTINSDAMADLGEAILTIAENHHAVGVEDFLTEHRDEIAHRLTYDPSDLDTFDLIDDEGKIIEGRVMEKVYAGEISDTVQLSVMQSESNLLHDVLCQKLTEYLNQNIQYSLELAIKRLESLENLIDQSLARFSDR